jgi:hypothetical protein
MELNYFIAQSEVASQLVRDKWLDTSSAKSRSFISSEYTQLTGITGNCDFSLFFTLEKKDNQEGSLLSNFKIQSNAGFSLNFNNNNELFLYSNSSKSDCYTFSDIRLAKKNCIGIIKASNNITLLNYDIDSKSIYKTESFTFKPETNLTGGGFFIGYNTYVLSKIELVGISGYFDQLVCFSGILEKEDYEKVFSGFLPLEGTSSNVYTKTSEIKQLERKNNSNLSQVNAEKFIPFLDYVSENYIPTNTGNYISTIFGTGSNALNKIFWSGEYSSSEDLLCYNTGTIIKIGGEYTPFSIGSNSIIFDDQIYYSMNNKSERTVSHLFSFYTGTNSNVEDFFTYNKLEKYTYVATENFTEIATASTYKQSLHMDGAINEKAFYMDSQILEKPYMLLQTQVGKSFKDIGKQLLFDTSNGLFRLDEEFVNGYNVYWGYSGKVDNYTIDETHITFPEILENGVYPVIYDKTSANPLQLFSNFTFSKGLFARGASIVFLGENSAKVKYRQVKEDYYETSTLHLSHGKRDRITLVDQNSIYKNTNSYWTNTFRTLGPFE